MSETQVHDIEDLVKVGHSMSACPYFAARHFKGAPPWLDQQSCITADALSLRSFAGLLESDVSL